MKRIWVAKIIPKPRNRLTDDDYHIEAKAYSPEEVVKELLKIKHRAWFELEKVEILRRTDLKGIKERYETRMENTQKGNS